MSLVNQHSFDAPACVVYTSVSDTPIRRPVILRKEHVELTRCPADRTRGKLPPIALVIYDDPCIGTLCAQCARMYGAPLS
jgi:hypothetical protein